MKAIVDADACVGCELCAETCRAVFRMNDGIAEVKADPVPTESETACRDAADGCPVQAIAIED